MLQCNISLRRARRKESSRSAMHYCDLRKEASNGHHEAMKEMREWLDADNGQTLMATY